MKLIQKRDRNNEIVERWRAGDSTARLAGIFGLSYSSVRRIVLRVAREEYTRVAHDRNPWRQHELNRLRDADIVVRRARGETFQSIAAIHGISHQRVRDIWLYHQQETTSGYRENLYERFRNLR